MQRFETAGVVTRGRAGVGDGYTAGKLTRLVVIFGETLELLVQQLPELDLEAVAEEPKEALETIPWLGGGRMGGPKTAYVSAIVLGSVGRVGSGLEEACNQSKDGDYRINPEVTLQTMGVKQSSRCNIGGGGRVKGGTEGKAR